MSHDFLQFRQGLVEKRDAITAAIVALDAVLGTPAPPTVSAEPTRPKCTRRNGAAEKPRRAINRTNERTNERSKARAIPAARSLPDGARVRLDLVPARDAAILARITRGPATAGELLSVLPAEPGQTHEQRETAVRNALTRLRVKRQIVQAEHGTWKPA